MKQNTLRLLPAVLILGIGTLAGETAPNVTTPVPGVGGPVPVTTDSRPFMAAADTQTPLNLPAFGYMEEEFLERQGQCLRLGLQWQGHRPYGRRAVHHPYFAPASHRAGALQRNRVGGHAQSCSRVRL